MWYIPKKLISALLPGAGGLISDSSSRARALAASLTWNGKHFVSRTWSLRWKRESWMRHLSGTMYQPSTERSFVTKYAESLADIPVSRSPLPATCLGTETRVTFGLTSSELSITPDLPGFGLKMSRTICGLDLSESGMTFSDWVTKLRRQWSGLRKTVARRIKESGCSLWPTAKARNVHGIGNHGEGSPDLQTKVASWPTPAAQDDNKSYEAHMAMKSRIKGGPRKKPTSLNVVSKAWQTPTKRDPEKKDYTYDRGDKTKKRSTLTKQAKNWNTPSTRDHVTDGPKAESRYGTPEMGTTEQRLWTQARLWPTVRATDYKSCGQYGDKAQKYRLDRKYLDATAVEFSHSGPQAPTSSKNGGKSSNDTRRLNLRQQTRRLNPRFVSWLMGWPVGFTAFECSATEWCRYRRLWRSVLLWILLGERRDD